MAANKTQATPIGPENKALLLLSSSNLKYLAVQYAKAATIPKNAIWNAKDRNINVKLVSDITQNQKSVTQKSGYAVKSSPSFDGIIYI